MLQMCATQARNNEYHVQNVYQTVMKYGSEVLNTASGSTLKALETTQNNALRLITRGVKTTPILAIQKYTGHLPITWEIKQQATVSMTKMKGLTQLGKPGHQTNSTSRPC
jgi:hypothetical protein